MALKLSAGRRLLLPALLVALVVGARASDAQSISEHTLAADTKWSTPYFVIDSGKEGPALVVVGGVHGNEPAGSRAAWKVKEIPIARGSIVLIPEANRPGLAENTRSMPGEPRELANLNRNFPGAEDDAPRGILAKAIWDLVTDKTPEMVVDLHEGEGFGAIDKETVGSSVIASGSLEAQRLARRMIDAINADISEETRRFRMRTPPVEGSLARTAADRLVIPSLIVETTIKTQSMDLRVDQQMKAVRRLLADLRMVPAETPEADGKRPGATRVALYDGCGVSGNPGYYGAIARILGGRDDIDLRCLGAVELRHGFLRDFDVVFFPGGSGSEEGHGLRKEGRDTVREFVAGGGGYVGICAGAYLASRNYSWSLKILDLDVIDRSHWKRGTGLVTIEMTPAGRVWLGDVEGALPIQYANGPLFAPAGDPDLPDAAVLATFRSARAERGARPETMIGTPAIVSAPFKKGRVVCSSPHPEHQESATLNPFVVRMVLWAAGKPVE